MSAKLLICAGLGAGALAGWSWIRSLKRAKDQMEVVPSAKVQELSVKGLTVRVDVKIKNPSKGSFSIRYPFLKLLHKGTTIGSSQALPRQIKIPANGEVMIEGIMVSIPALNIFSVGYSLVKSLLQKQPSELTIQVISAVSIGPIESPYENKITVTI